MVSARKTMVMAMVNAIDKTYGEMVTDVVNAAWHKFDPADKSTWPEFAKEVLVEIGGEAALGSDLLGLDENGKLFWWSGRDLDEVKIYADPQDLMFKEIENE